MRLTIFSKFVIILVLSLCCSFVSFGQQPYNRQHNDVSFMYHLINNEDYKDAIALYNYLPYNQFSKMEKDSLNYFKGWSFYKLKQLDSSAIFLEKVTEKSNLYAKSVFFSVLNRAGLEQYNIAKQSLANFKSNIVIEQEVQQIFKSGIAIIERDTSILNQIPYNSPFHELESVERNLIGYKMEALNYKIKNPYTAGVLSALIPGLGRAYAGNPKQGLGTFLSLFALGALSYESISNRGLNNIQSYFWVSTFSIFHIGNIWGSFMTVKNKKREHEREIKNKVLIDIHIALLSIFN